MYDSMSKLLVMISAADRSRRILYRSGLTCLPDNNPIPWNGAAISRAAGENGGSAFAFADSRGMMTHV
jgi:hypothetical protein